MEIVIITNGNIYNLKAMKDKIIGKYIICVDGAGRYLMELDIIPNLLIGDLDSIKPNVLAWMDKNKVPCKSFPSRKNATDTELALEYAIGLKAKSITIFGAIGSRQDHTISNILLLHKLLQTNIQGKIINENNVIMMTDSKLEVHGKKGENISIIPLSGSVKGVTLKGLEYPLDNEDLVFGNSLGISNVFTSDMAKITLDQGLLLVIKAKD